MNTITTCNLPAEDIACWIAEIEREYSTLPRGAQRIARKQLDEFRVELGIRNELDWIETEQRYFAKVETHAARIESDGFELPF
jgi:hypothetical protein